MNKFLAALKQPTTWVIVIVTALAVTAYSALRNPLKSIATKLPGADS